MTIPTKKMSHDGFTLIETLVAITLLSIAVVAPMSLAARSLGSAIYARDQITAFYLAQEAIEALRSIRDAQILTIAQSTGGAPDMFGSIPHDNSSFIIDARKIDPANAITPCSGGPCPALKTNHTLYGYENETGWEATNFTRTVHACFVQSNGTCASPPTDELRVTVTVEWKTGPIQKRTFSISENLYRWVNDGSGQQ